MRSSEASSCATNLLSNTLDLSYLTGSASSRRLGDLCEAEGVPLVDAHNALGDVDATARLLAIYLRRARAGGVTTFEGLGVAPAELPPAYPPPNTPARVQARRAARPVTMVKAPAPATGDPATDAYLNAVEHSDFEEMSADQRVQMARELGLDPVRLARSAAHR